MAHRELTAREYDTFVASPVVDDVLGGADGINLVLVHADGQSIASPGSLPVVVAAIGNGLGGTGPESADLVVGADDIERLVAAVDAAPLAARTTAVLLRTIASVPQEHGLALESAAYSLLQAGPEFARWRATAQFRPDDRQGPTVVVERTDDTLTITLDRPHRHNAIDACLRDELCAALAVATADDSITAVEFRGNGPSFCSGGDLGEFGSRPDVATAHIIRLTRSPARQLLRLSASTSVTAHIHGATQGGGIEMAAFAGRVVADSDTVIRLPEIELGLLPGAGGTVSITARVGRQRTAALALTATSLDAATAMEWGLVDALEQPPAHPLTGS